MADCRKCVRVDMCYDGEEDCIGFVPKPITNADRIRAMTDEELADFIYDKNEDGSREAWLEWLKKEVD